jgi:hypothetical protein
LLSGCLNRVKPSILRCMGVDGDNSIYADYIVSAG